MQGGFIIAPDNVAGMDVVTAEARLVRASSDENAGANAANAASTIRVGSRRT